jgi:ATP-dependent Clp protease ATP-binding subunit ClpA
VDKAHPSVFKVLIQILDDGMLIDGKRRNVDFKNTIIIMTSNLGSENLPTRIAGEKPVEFARDLLMKQVSESQIVSCKAVTVTANDIHIILIHY